MHLEFNGIKQGMLKFSTMCDTILNNKELSRPNISHISQQPLWEPGKAAYSSPTFCGVTSASQELLQAVQKLSPFLLFPALKKGR